MATRPEVTGRKTTTVERAAYSIREFCVAHRISESFYFKLRARGLGPRELWMLDKVTITNEAAADWRKTNEQSEPAA